jgi:hypothetical protein
MDPASILSIVGTAVKLAATAKDAGEGLYKFIDDARNVSKAVRDLAQTVQAFADTCLNVRSSLEILNTAYSSLPNSILHRLQRRENNLVCGGIKSHLGDCETVILELNSALEGVKKPHSDVAAQTWRHISLEQACVDTESLGSAYERSIHRSSSDQDVRRFHPFALLHHTLTCH